MAGTTGLEPATSAVTGQRSNQLSYVPSIFNRLDQTALETERTQTELDRLTERLMRVYQISCRRCPELFRAGVLTVSEGKICEVVARAGVLTGTERKDL